MRILSIPRKGRAWNKLYREREGIESKGVARWPTNQDHENIARHRHA